MSNASQITEAINSAVLFVARHQDANGGFSSLSFEKDKIEDGVTHQTIYYPALIATLLEDITSEEARTIVEKIQLFLTHQQNRWFTFNYWAHQDEAFEQEPYPDDLDDTCLALTALSNPRQKIISGKALAHLTMVLTDNETKPGGPYRTWIVNQPHEEPWNDTDLAVNATIAYFLKKQNIYLPDLEKYFRDCLTAKKISSPYYYSSLLVLFLITRASSPELYPMIQEALYQQTSHDLTATELALYVSILIYTQAPTKEIDPFIQKILDRHDEYQADPVITEKHQNNTLIISGCAALTAALRIHALRSYQQLLNDRQTSTISHHGIEEALHSEIVKQTARLFVRHNDSLQQVGLDRLGQMVATPIAREITLTSFHIGKYLDLDVPESVYVNLGVANLLGWLGYDIHDQCYDTGSVTAALTVAPLCLREALGIYYGLAQHYGLDISFIKDTLNLVDQGYATEFGAHKLISDQPNISLKQIRTTVKISNGRSRGHVIGPVLIFQIAKQPYAYQEALENFFVHYLTAKHISDDTHDWREDLRSGLITHATAPIISEWRRRYPEKDEFDYIQNESTLENIFWHQVYTSTLQKGVGHLQQARWQLETIPWMHDPRFLSDKCAQLQNSFTQNLQDHEKITEFLEYYNGH